MDEHGRQHRDEVGPVTSHGARFVAVDWSGRLTGASEFIWTAEVVGGALVELRNGRSREAVIDHLRALARSGAAVVAGLDFAFSAPAWWVRSRGHEAAPQLWEELRGGLAEELLAGSPSPFWGRPAPRPPIAGAQLRVTERPRSAGGPAAKSVFQIGGAGAVGTGSLRGMALLGALAEDYAIWPWSSGGQMALEIYPRLLTGAVRKSRWRERRELLDRYRDELSPAMLERAAGSEDAFDAAVSAIELWRARAELATLRPASDQATLLEGAIWAPGAGAELSPGPASDRRSPS